MDEIPGSAYDQLVSTLNKCKEERPADRSMRDRAFAVVITDLERIVAYYQYWINESHYDEYEVKR